MKAAILSMLLLCAAPVFAQERKDTIYGVALVLDTLEVWQTDKLTTSVWPAFSITSSRMVKKNDTTVPKITGVKYYRLDNCAEIHPKRIFHFKQI